MDTREHVLVVSALLHDIGKFVQRASTDFNKKNHETFGKEFLERYLNMDSETKKQVLYLVESHHNIPYLGDYPELLKILKLADGKSAEHDRKESEGVDKRINQKPLLSVYSYIDIGLGQGREVHYSLAPLGDELNYPRAIDMAKNSQTIYASLLKEFQKDLENLFIRDKGSINTLLYILLKYTKYIPSAIYKSAPDIPLYDHLKTTAAIALCNYRSVERKKYLLIMGDLSGIQNFIFYNLKGGESQTVDEHATKRMRGRSFLINLIIDSAVRYILEELDLYEFNILWESGGNFLILAPNQGDADEKLSTIRERINRFLKDNFGRLYLNMAWLAVEDIGGEDRGFDDILHELHEVMDDNKSRKYIDFVRENDFYVGKRGGPYLCPVCGVHFVSSQGEICDVCKKIENLGNLVGKARYLIRDISSSGDFVFDYGNVKVAYSLVASLDPYHADRGEVFDISEFKMPNLGTMRGFRILKTFVPSVDSRVLSISEILSMDDAIDDRVGKIGDVSSTKGKMAIFKADVDCLGEIFAKGLKRSGRVTMSLVSTLSFMMDLFFTKEINNIARKNNVYVVFSGGDDLTVVGRYDEVIKFAMDVNRKFRKWTGENKNIHMSGSIVFFDEKFPIRRGADIAEETLEKAKNYRHNINLCAEKGNLVAIFGEVLSWDDLEKQVELADKLLKAQRERRIPSSLSHVLLTLHKLSPEFYATQPLKRGSVVIPSPKPYLRYYFARRNRDDELLRELSDEKIFRYIPVGVSLWVMNRKYRRGEVE